MSRKPNIVFITSHDTGRHFGCYGIDEVNTPNIDALAGDGALLENFFCTSPVCSPSRGAMYSGLYPQSNGMMGLIHPQCNWTYKPDVKHLSQRLRDRGYRTSLFFQQHEVMPDKVEERLAFDDYLARQDTGISPTDVSNAFADYIDAYDSDAPFYAQIGFGMTHTPWASDNTRPDAEKGVCVPPHLVNNEAARENLSCLQGAVRHLDSAVGTIVDAVNGSRFADNTIVVYTVDHGIEVPRAKWTLYDPGIAVAFVIRWPGGGITGGRRCPQLLSNVDVTPTLLALIGDDVPATMEGKSFAGVLRDPEHPPVRDAVFAEYVQANQPEARCVRTNRYKFIRNFSNHRLFVTPVDMSNPRKAVDRVDSDRDNAFCPVTQLYDLENDPLEFANLSGDPSYAAVERELNDRLWQWLEEVGDPILEGPLRVPLYSTSIADYDRYRADRERTS